MDITLYHDRLFEIALRTAKLEHLAQDIVQEVYLQSLIDNINGETELLALCHKISSRETRQHNYKPDRPMAAISFLDEGEDALSYVLNQISLSDEEPPPLFSKERVEGIKLYGKKLPFDLARAFARTLGLRTRRAWLAFCNSAEKPRNIPKYVDESYHEFTTWDDFLGCGYLSYEECKEWTRENMIPKGINSLKKWKKYIKAHFLPPSIPRYPEKTYRCMGMWKDEKDFFGKQPTLVGRNQSHTFLGYEEAKKLIREELPNITSQGKYESYRAKLLKLHPDGLHPHLNLLPANPDKVYKRTQQWAGWPAFLETNNKRGFQKNTNILPFNVARLYILLCIKPQGIDSGTKWRKYVTGQCPTLVPLPTFIPKWPDSYYQEFKGWPHWFDTTPKNIQIHHWSYADSKNWLRKNIDTSRWIMHDWEEYCAGKKKGLISKPREIPTKPWLVYKEQYKNLDDWLERSPRKKAINKRGIRTLPYSQCAAYVQKHLVPQGVIDIPSWEAFIAAEKLPGILPLRPWQKFKNKGWINERLFFGKIPLGIEPFNYTSLEAKKRQQLKDKGIHIRNTDYVTITSDRPISGKMLKRILNECDNKKSA